MRIRLFALTLVLTGIVVLAQQPAPAGAGRGPGRAPTAPPGIAWASPPLPDGPIVLDTGIQHQIRLTVTKGLAHPFSMAFLPDGAILITERPGRLRIVRNGVLDPTPVAGLPQIRAQGLGGLMDLALDPHFAENKLIYFTYDKPAATGNGGVRTLGRARWDGTAMTDERDLFSAIPSGNASRIIFGRDGMIYMTIGIGDNEAMKAQDLNELAGKVLRLKDDGTVPPDNPFVGKAGARPEIYTYGHRNGLGLALEPETGRLWECEDGPNGGDEVNILQAGKNYGWPVVSNGRFYLGPKVSVGDYKEGMEPPVVYWVPAIAVSGLTFYTGDKFPRWKNNLFVGGMRQGEVPRSGQLVRLDFNDEWEELHRESMFHELQNRIRDVRQGPDGLLYVLTEENDGALLKMEPWAAPGPGR
jgi:aldose sugar dehydrogenase